MNLRNITTRRLREIRRQRAGVSMATMRQQKPRVRVRAVMATRFDWNDPEFQKELARVYLQLAMRAPSIKNVLGRGII